MKLINLTLPEFAFLDGQCHEGNTLEHRDVVIHIRSAAIVEFLDEKNVNLNDNAISVNFVHKNLLEVEEHKVCVLHYCTQLENKFDIITHVIKPAIEWYKSR